MDRDTQNYSQIFRGECGMFFLSGSPPPDASDSFCVRVCVWYDDEFVIASVVLSSILLIYSHSKCIFMMCHKWIED